MSTSAAACGDDDGGDAPPAPDDGITGGTGGDGDGTLAGAGGTGGTPGDGLNGDTPGDGTNGDDFQPVDGGDTVQCDPEGEGACQNPDDCPVVEAGMARDAASVCGIACLGQADEEQCARDCLVEDTGLTDDCADCYIAIVACSRDNCLSPCVADAESDECFQCQVDAGCRADFDECSGLPPVER